METGIASGNELVGSLWVLLLSVAALRTGGLPRALNYLGLVLGVAGILTIIPAAVETTIMIFGTGMIVWSGLGGDRPAAREPGRSDATGGHLRDTPRNNNPIELLKLAKHVIFGSET